MNGDVVFALTVLAIRLADAEKRLGGPIHVRSAASGWRPYAEQKRYWDLYLAGGNLASNPDTGLRGHMRGASIDIFREDAAARRAMLAAGFIPDPAEPWHWSIPNFLAHPVIKTLPEDAMTIEYDRDLGAFQRIFQYGVRDRGAEGSTLFDRFTRVDGVTSTTARRQEEINTRAEQRHAETLAAVASADAKDAARDAALLTAVRAIAAGTGADPAALAAQVVKAAQDGASRALAAAKLPTPDTVAAAVIGQQERAELERLRAELARRGA